MVRPPETRYAKGPGGNIAYRVVGDGPMNLVIAPGWLSHVDVLSGDPGWEKFVGRFASFARVIQYDKRGTGLSDPVDGVPTLESRADDLRAVLDATDTERTALFGLSEGGPISVLFAATYPERVQALILFGTYANGTLEDDGSPGRARWIRLMARVQDSIEHWGEGRTADWALPSLCHIAEYRRAVGTFERASMSPGMAQLTLNAVLTKANVQDILGSVRVPTLVLHRKNEAIPVEFARHIAEEIPTARLVELDGADHFPSVGDFMAITDEVEEFLTGERHEHPADRVWPPSSSLTLSTPPSGRQNSVTATGVVYSSATTSSPARRSAASRGASSNTLATASWLLSTGPPEPFGVPPPSPTACRNWASMSEAAYTRANASFAKMTSAESPFTSEPESLRLQRPARYWCPVPSRTS